MPRFRQTAEIVRLMSQKERIRNVGVVAHIDHGKTTMTDSLLAEAGLLPLRMAGSARALDYLEEEQRRGITIKTANISLLHERGGDRYVINLVDTPGHVDFAGKVTRALRAIDGVVVVIDAVEEIMAQTETVTRQALEERVKPVLFINKVDRLIREMKLTAEEVKDKFTRIVRDFNSLIEIYCEPDFKEDWKVDPEKESVAFGSALDKWGFTLGIANQKAIKFTDIISAYEKDEQEELSKLMPLHDAILNMAVRHVPDPREAQKHRLPRIWKGSLDSEIGRAMLACDDHGPTAMCITNVQVDSSTGVVATGRVFSGSIREGSRVYLVGAGVETEVQQVSMFMGAYREAVKEIPAGNIAAVFGLDKAKAGETLVDVRLKDVMVPFEVIRYVSEPIVTVAVEPRNVNDLPRLMDALNKLTTEDPNLSAAVDRDTGQYLLRGTGELHLEIAAKFLKQYSGMDVAVSNPVIAYRETVTDVGSAVMAKSQNRQNSFQVQVEPLEEEIVRLMEKGELHPEMREKVWVLDPYRNVLTVSAEHSKSLQQVRNSVTAGFQWACRSGPLCEEPLRGVKAKLVDAQLSENPQKREPTQITRAVSRAILGSVLTAKPALLEPVYRIEVSVPVQWLGTCSNIITRKRGKILVIKQTGALARIEGFLPTAESLGLALEMRSATSGRAFWQSVFDHWEQPPKDLAKEVVTRLRLKRGLPSAIPTPDTFVDET